MVGRLFSAYPKTDYDDPKAALVSMVHVLSAYPLKLVDRLTNLETGMQLRHKFPPRLAEIKTEADALMSDKATQLARNTRVAEQIAARAEAEKPKEARPSIAELKAKYGENYGIDPEGASRKAVENLFRAPTVEELRAYYAEHPERITKLTGPAGTR